VKEEEEVEEAPIIKKAKAKGKKPKSVKLKSRPENLLNAKVRKGTLSRMLRNISRVSEWPNGMVMLWGRACPRLASPRNSKTRASGSRCIDIAAGLHVAGG
jgi:hypothetical protein